MWRVVAFLLLLTTPANATPPDIIIAAEYSEPTTRYAHGVLGDAVEWGALVLTVDKCFGCEGTLIETITIRLPENRVFEDIAPRLITGNEGHSLVMVVESDLAVGARLALYDASGLHAATPFIGQPNRWLAPIGAGDLDGDGAIEIAYIDRPHLAKTLRVWRLSAQGLTPVAELGGLSNHRIGEDFISGGLRDCGTGLEMIVASGNWQKVMAVRLETDQLQAHALAGLSPETGFAAAMACH